MRGLEHMDGADLLVWALVLFFGLRGLFRLVRSFQRDRAWPDQVRRFAEAHGLREEQVEPAAAPGPPDWRDFLRRPFRDPSAMSPPPGSSRLVGRVASQPFVLDQIFLKPPFGGGVEAFVRMAVELDLPPGLAVHPRGRPGRFWQRLRPTRLGTPEGYAVRLANRSGAGRGSLRGWLTPTRRRMLEQARRVPGEIHVAHGRFWLIRSRHRRPDLNLEEMFAQFEDLIRRWQLG